MGSVVDANVDYIKCEKVFVVDKFYFVCVFNLLETRSVNNFEQLHRMFYGTFLKQWAEIGALPLVAEKRSEGVTKQAVCRRRERSV